MAFGVLHGRQHRDVPPCVVAVGGTQALCRLVEQGRHRIYT